MKHAIIGYSMYVLVTEPRNTLFFKMFDFNLRTIEWYYSLIQIYIAVIGIKALTKPYTNG